MVAGFLDTLNSTERSKAEHALTNTTEAATREVAGWFRRISDHIWRANELTNLFFLQPPPKTIAIQKEFNNKLVTLDPQQNGNLYTVTSDDFAPLFAPGQMEDWPNLLLTSNHARAWQSEDLTDLIKGITQIAGDAGKSLGSNDLQLHSLRHTNGNAGGSQKKLGGKTIVALACHTERDVFQNGAELIDRRLELQEDNAGNADPAQRTLKHMSPAAMRLAKLMLKLMVEPQAGHPNLIDLDRAEPDKGVSPARFSHDPRVAAAHTHSVTLRADATSIAQHIKLAGYSKGANTVTDALRFFYVECAALMREGRLQVRTPEGERAVGDDDIKNIIQNIGLLSISPGEVPLTDAEKYKVGISRVTIHNSHDLTAGHLVNPNAKDYNEWYDRLITIEGTTAEFGHGIKPALGADGNTGFIMSAEKSREPAFLAAQDALRAYFASNHQVNAVSTICVSPEPRAEGGMDNVLLVQFAPGVTRADTQDIERVFLTAIQKNGFPNATVESDLDNRRRLRIVLDHDGAKRPIVTNEMKDGGKRWGAVNGCSHDGVNKVRSALQEINAQDGNGLYLIQAVDQYLEGLLDLPDRGSASTAAHQGRVAGNGKVKKVA